MPPADRRDPILWTPRILTFAYAAFLTVFALDVFGEEEGVSATLAALAVHLVPALVVLAVLALAWRWEWIGALAFGAWGAGSTLGRLHLVIAAPALLIAALFLVVWLRRARRQRVC